jgi:hypothetical protein
MAGAKDFSFTERLKEIDRFFQGRSAVHQAMRRLAKRLERAKIPYAIFGGMAVNAHGHHQTTDDVDVLLTPDGLAAFRRLFEGKGYHADSTSRRRRFIDQINGVPVDIVVSGTCPCFLRKRPVTYPDPVTVGEVIDNLRFVGLEWLIQLKLGIGRFRDKGDVAALIGVHDLDESFMEKLHPSVHQDFIDCLEEKRREDEYEAREMEP